MAHRRQTVLVACLAAALAVQVCAAASVTIQGQLEASDVVWLGRRTQVGGRSSDVVEKLVPEGSHVKKGDFVFRLDTAPMAQYAGLIQTQADKNHVAADAARAKLETLRGRLEAEKAKGPALLAPFTLEVERLKALPDAVDLSAAQARLKAAQAALKEAGDKHQALDQLAARGMASQQTLQAAGYDVDIATAERDKAQAALDGVRLGANPFDLKLAELAEQKERMQIASDAADMAAQVRAAEISLTWAQRVAAATDRKLKTARGELDLASRCAPKDGIVVYAPAEYGGGKVEQGARVRWGCRVAGVMSGKAFQFRGTATEAVLSRMRPGLEARVHVDALPHAVLKGRVAAFDVSLAQQDQQSDDPTATERPRPRVFEVVVALDKVPDGLMPGMSAQAEVELDSGAPMGSALSAQVAAAWQSTDGRVPLLLGGYVAPVRRAPVFILSDLAGYVTYLAQPYAHVKAGDPVLECTADRAEAKLVEAEDEPRFASDLLDLARTNAEDDAQQRQAQVQAADVDVQIAQAGLDKLHAPPRDCDVRAAEADVRAARARLEKARQKLSVEKAAGLASGSTIDSLELAARRTDIALQQAQLRRSALTQGPPEEQARLAEFRVERAKKQKAMLQDVGAAARASGQASVHTYEVRLQTAQDRLKDARRLYANRVARAPIAGNVVFNPRPGFGSGRLRLGDTIPTVVIEAAYVADLSKLRFCAVVEQSRVGDVRPGERAEVELLALPGRILTGRVEALMPVVQDREEVLTPEQRVPVFSGVRCSKALISLDLPADLVGRVLPSMTGTARILPETKTAEAGGPR